MMFDTNKFISDLEAEVKSIWERAYIDTEIIPAVLNGEFDIRLYGIFMLETYHYTSHNAKNQAAVAVRAHNVSPQYIKYCFEHAEEETGHELMALHDLFSVGVEKAGFDIPRPLAMTEAFIAYLYWVSTTGCPYRRLGYSFWAESAYEHITPVLAKIKNDLGLVNSQMTFLVSHATIDEKHAEDVNKAIIANVTTQKQAENLREVTHKSLQLSFRQLDSVYKEYKDLCSGISKKYDFLNILMK